MRQGNSIASLVVMKRAVRGSPTKPTLINNDDIDYDDVKPTARTSFACFAPTVLLLAGLLLSTLYALRVDRMKLKEAESYIQDFKLHLDNLEQQVASHQLRAKLLDAQNPIVTTLTATCSTELIAIRKQVDVWTDTAQETERKVEEAKRKCTNSEQQIAAIQALKEQLSEQVNTKAREKRILAKRVGIKMASALVQQ